MLIKLGLYALIILMLSGCGVEKKFGFFKSFNAMNDIKVNLTLGNFRLVATDAPFDYSFVSSAKIILSKFELKNAEGVYQPGLAGDIELDLIKLRNGRFSIMAEFDMPTGDYQEIKLYVKEASIELTNGKKFNLDVPMGAKNGVAVAFPQTVKVDKLTPANYLLDFDLSKSFLPRGDVSDVEKITGFDFFPVLRISNIDTAGGVGGYIFSSDKKSLKGAVVTVTQGSLSASAVTEEDGMFALIGLPAGEYKAKITAPDHIEQDDVSVKVEQGEVSILQTILIKTTL